MTAPATPVTRPAAQMSFDSVEAMQPRANNFYLMFLVMSKLPDDFRDVYRHRPAFHRFAELYPERVAALEQALEAEDRRPGEQSWPLLLEAYQLMRELVDMGDFGVIPPPHLPYPEIDPATGVDALYLTR
ncbi:MAG TPA: hypothetical protein VLF67_03190 [Candidatus Saccharimonas sp.]|nr:hypothetical protein [Candidatus Saccharimonas sp.]